MNIDAFTLYFLNKNDIDWEDIFAQDPGEFMGKAIPAIRHLLTEAGIHFTPSEIEEVSTMLWEKLRENKRK
jgi:hypothetical protein